MYNDIFVQTQRMYNAKSEPKCNLWALDDYDASNRFITCTKCTTPMEAVDNGEGYACVGGRGDMGISVLFPVNLKLL